MIELWVVMPIGLTIAIILFVLGCAWSSDDEEFFDCVLGLMVYSGSIICALIWVIGYLTRGVS